MWDMPSLDLPPRSLPRARSRQASCSSLLLEGRADEAAPQAFFYHVPPSEASSLRGRVLGLPVPSAHEDGNRDVLTVSV